MIVSILVLIWALFGAFIGYVAAGVRGFPVVPSVIGGMIIGPVAVVLFFVGGE